MPTDSLSAMLQGAVDPSRFDRTLDLTAPTSGIGYQPGASGPPTGAPPAASPGAWWQAAQGMLGRLQPHLRGAMPTLYEPELAGNPRDVLRLSREGRAMPAEFRLGVRAGF